MATLDRKQARALVAEVTDRIAEVARKYGLEVNARPVAFEPSGRFLKLELVSNAPVAVKAAAKRAARAVAKQAKQAPVEAVGAQGEAGAKAVRRMGITSKVIGRQYQLGGHTYTVTVVNKDRPTKPVTVTREDGVSSAITAAAVRRRLRATAA